MSPRRRVSISGNTKSRPLLTRRGHGRKAQPFPAGSFFALSPGTALYVFIDEETIVQISTNGPWGLTYLNPKDDPRQKSQ
jgi:hypothetical protein